jgi:hypothetical protein
MSTITKLELAEFIQKQAHAIGGENILLHNEINEVMRNLTVVDVFNKTNKHEDKLNYYDKMSHLLQGKMEMLNAIAVKFLDVDLKK